MHHHRRLPGGAVNRGHAPRRCRDMAMGSTRSTSVSAHVCNVDITCCQQSPESRLAQYKVPNLAVIAPSSVSASVQPQFIRYLMPR